MLCVLFAMLAFGWHPQAFAAQTDGSLTLNKAEPNTVFRLYQVETRNEDGTFEVTDDFAGYDVDWDIESPEDMRKVASTLASYVAQDQDDLTPYATETADSSGTAVFSDLPFGLYIAIADDVKTEGKTVLTAPVLAFIPATAEDGSAIYDLQADVKKETRTDQKQISVCKIWSGDTEKTRPKSIEVNLLQDGKVIDTVTLNADNNWQYKWSDLKAGHTYKVTEKSVPSGYKVSITEDKTAFTIKNTKPNTPPPHNPPNIPKTGQLWWPVSILAAVGLLFLCIGILRRRREQ